MKIRCTTLLVLLCILIMFVAPAYADELSGIDAVPYGSTVEVATLTIYAYGEDVDDPYDDGVGHAFISIKNRLNIELTVGIYVLQPGEMISIGKFAAGTRGRSDGGIWYNLEVYQRSTTSLATRYACCSVALTMDDINTINAVIASHDSYNLYTNNCCHFAVAVWNSVTAFNYTTGNDLRPYDVMTDINATIGHVSNYAPYKQAGVTKVGYAKDGSFRLYYQF